jgi:hypothetical protein
LTGKRTDRLTLSIVARFFPFISMRWFGVFAETFSSDGRTDHGIA